MTFRSELLKKELKIPVSTKALRCIDKAGGLDNYLLSTKPTVINSKLGAQLRDEMITQWQKLQKLPFSRATLKIQQRAQIAEEKGPRKKANEKKM